MNQKLSLVPVPTAVQRSARVPGKRPRPLRFWRGLRARLRRLHREERGAVTAEYAIVILAAVAFAGLLVAIMQSAEIRAMLVQLVENALGEGQ